MKTTEIRVRPVVRYLVTRFTASPMSDGGSETIGEFDNEGCANEVAKALVEIELALAAKCASSEAEKARRAIA